MQCDEFTARFDELLDRRREPLDEPDMAEHVARCAECRRTSAAVGAAIGALAELSATGCRAAFDPATDLPLERILAAIRREAAIGDAPTPTPLQPAPSQPDPFQAGLSRSDLTQSVTEPGVPPLTTGATTTSTVSRTSAGGLWRGSAFYALLATAAMIVLAAYPIWRWNAVSPGAGPNTAVAEKDPPPLAAPQTGAGDAPKASPFSPDGPPREDGGDSESLPSFTELARESRDSYEQLVRDTGRSLGDALAVADLFSSDAPSYSAQTEPGDGWLDQVESGWEPLKRSTLGTLDVLRQVVPADTETRS